METTCSNLSSNHNVFGNYCEVMNSKLFICFLENQLTFPNKLQKNSCYDLNFMLMTIYLVLYNIHTHLP